MLTQFTADFTMDSLVNTNFVPLLHTDSKNMSSKQLQTALVIIEKLLFLIDFKQNNADTFLRYHYTYNFSKRFCGIFAIFSLLLFTDVNVQHHRCLKLAKPVRYHLSQTKGNDKLLCIHCLQNHNSRATKTTVICEPIIGLSRMNFEKVSFKDL